MKSEAESTAGVLPESYLLLHTGVLATKFSDLPSHHEIDVRLLRCEMVLTESQQANLFRMIDAGLTNKGANSLNGITKADFDRLARSIERAWQLVRFRLRWTTAEVARATYKDTSELIEMDYERVKNLTE
jgi:hypothetical protein